MTTWGADRKLWQWDVATGKRIGHSLLPDGWFFHVAFSPDNKMLATTANGVGYVAFNEVEGAIQLWDGPTGKKLHKLGKAILGTVAPTSAFSPDCKTLAVWGLGQTKAGLFDVRTGKELRTLDIGDGMAPSQRGHVTSPPLAGSAMVFSPDSRLLAMRSSARTVGVWHVASGRNVRQLPLPEAVVSGPLVTSAYQWSNGLGVLPSHQMVGRWRWK